MSIFISYSHIDNEPQPGWVSDFHRHLEIRLNQLQGKRLELLWRDPQLKGSDGLDQALTEQLAQAQILMPIISPGYVNSKWCGKEREKFLELHPEFGPERIVKIDKLPPKDRDALPGILRSLLGYRFYEKDPEDKMVVELSREDGKDYIRKINKLARDILEIFLENVERQNQEETPAALREAEGGKENGITIFLAECSSDLREARDSLRHELKRRGHTILPKNSLPFEKNALEAVCRKAIAASDLCVHFISPTYGVVPENDDRSVIDLQLRAAMDSTDANIMLWTPEGIQFETDREEQQEFLAFLQSDLVSHRTLDRIEHALEDFRSALFNYLKKPVAEPPLASTGSDSTYLYLMYDERDDTSAQDLADELFDYGFEVRTPIFEGDETAIRKDKEANLRDCDVILVYHQSAGEAWLNNTLRELERMHGLGRSKPVLGKAIYVAGGQRKPRTRVAEVLTGIAPFDKEMIRQFAERMLASNGGQA